MERKLNVDDGKLKLNAECGMRVGTARCPREHQHAREMPIRDDPAAWGK
jgi:hypothetical protein